MVGDGAPSHKIDYVRKFKEIHNLEGHRNCNTGSRATGGNSKFLYFFLPQKNAINPFFDASGNKNIGATICFGCEIQFLPYAGFF